MVVGWCVGCLLLTLSSLSRMILGKRIETVDPAAFAPFVNSVPFTSNTKQSPLADGCLRSTCVGLICALPALCGSQSGREALASRRTINESSPIVHSLVSSVRRLSVRPLET